MDVRQSKKWLILLGGLAAFSLLLFFGRPSARILPQERLETLWIERMLDGRSEAVEFIRTHGDPSIHPRAQVVQPFLASPTGFRELPKAVRVLDLRGSYLWGLFGLSGGGGWELQGGLLDEVALPAGDKLELFLLRITYVRAALMPLWINYFDKSGVSFKVFLVRHNRENRRAEILRTWEIPPAQVEWKYPPDLNLLRPMTTASLTYNRKENRITVTITGIRRGITERIEIDDKAR